ncbi:MAG: glycosyltransferase family 2 protein, partial [Candidatus Omnitrophota bacterium]
MSLIFWISAAFLFYVYLGYPFLLWILPKKPSHSDRENDFPVVSVVVSAFNEEAVIAKKMENLLSLDYPKDKIEILVGSDGSTDETEKIVASYAGKGVRLLVSAERKGKARMLNQLAEQAKGEILVFTDARQRIDSGAVRELVKRFADPKVGCASGELFLENTDGPVGKGMGLYWDYEKFIRQKESDLDSVIGATGALYALRRSLYRPMPDETLLDDVYLPMKAVAQGYRTVFEEKARVFDDASETPRQEYERKVRTLAGNYQIFSQLSEALNPFRSRVAFQFISHKLLRVAAPLFLILLFAASLVLVEYPLYRTAFIAQCLFYGLAFVGAAAPRWKNRLFSVPYTFCLLNVCAVTGLYRYVTGRQTVTWKVMTNDKIQM